MHIAKHPAKHVVRAALVGLALCAGPAQAADTDFYKGNTVNLYVGYSPGGGYDVYARLLARFMGKHIPGSPTVVVQNMPGAGSLRAANWLYNVAPKDGTAFAIVARGAAFDPLFGLPGTQFDATKFNWLGSANDEVSVCVSWNPTQVKTYEDLLTKELVVGGTGGSADTDQFPRVMNGVLGTKMKMVVGYPGGNDVNLAMERGEVQGRCGWSWSSVKSTQPDWLKNKKINVLIQLSMNKHEDLPDVPAVIEKATTDEQRQILKLVFARQIMGRPFMAPPGVPPERVAILRKAFMETMKDTDFLAEAEKAKLEVTPVSGEEIQKLVSDSYKVAPEIAKKAGDLLK
ncbi:MAG: tripartite tricarboxylate transporter family receptor [Hyphomicrobiales bacterium]|nr:tripartite tricarboxylate transporter family receptor [Hyphomicrobiales bacterium]